jgi:hypothetical protein
MEELEYEGDESTVDIDSEGIAGTHGTAEEL